MKPNDGLKQKVKIIGMLNEVDSIDAEKFYIPKKVGLTKNGVAWIQAIPTPQGAFFLRLSWLLNPAQPTLSLAPTNTATYILGINKVG